MKLYSITDGIAIHKDDFYFCKSIEDLSYYCGLSHSRIFEVEVGKVIQKGRKLYSANEFKLVNELTKESLEKYFQDNLDRFIKENHTRILTEIVRMGFCFDKLKDFKDDCIRAEIAERGEYLDRYKDDKSWWVRLRVARNGKYLRELKDDENEWVRKEALRQLELQNNQNNALNLE